jgi:hypothetical protein
MANPATTTRPSKRTGPQKSRHRPGLRAAHASVEHYASASPNLVTTCPLDAGGTAAGSGNQGSFALARYLANGRRDMTFGTQGLVTTSFGNSTTAGISVLGPRQMGKSWLSVVTALEIS